MNMTKKILIGVGVALVCVVLLMSSFRAYLSWTHQYFYGSLSQQGDDVYTLTTPAGQLSVQVGEKTRIRKGKRAALLELGQGESAMVVGAINSSGVLEARFIRFVKKHNSQ